jgi:NHLM bacteriocin system ABC transporter peptidase/ATP-binding protein
MRGRRVRVPTILQMEAVECGAACLAMILAYYGRWVSLARLREQTGVSRDGANALNLVKVARGYGLEAHAFRREPDTLGDLPMPFVVFWNMNHFVVVEGLRNDGSVLLNDPAVGPRRVAADEFDRSFTGIVLTFEPGARFEKGGTPTRLWDGLRQRLGGSLAGLWLVVLLTLLLVVPGLIMPALLRIFVDDVLIAGRSGWVRPLFAAFFVIVAIRTALTYLRLRYLLRLQMALAIGASTRFVWHLLTLPMAFFSQRFAGDVARRVDANDRVASLLSGQLSTNMVGLLSAGFYAVVLLSYNVGLGALGIGLELVNLVVLRLVWRRREDINRLVLQVEGKLTATSMNGLQMMETIKATGAEPDFFSRWAGYQAKLVTTTQQLGLYSLVVQVAPSLLSGLTHTAILCYGALVVMSGDLTVGELVAFQSLMLTFAGPIMGFVTFGSRLQEITGDLARLDDVLRYPVPAPPGRPRVSARRHPKLDGRVEMRDVRFGYSRLAEPLIDGFSLSLRPGARIAIVGATGSGKSTVLRLLTGLYRPWEGEILFDGHPAREIDPEVLAGSIAAVDEDVFLFDGTIRQNLTLWDATVPDAVVRRAARDACIDEVIASRPGGYEARVHEGGINFSGGERQRLEMARGLAQDPTILVLDEATASLDAVTERDIDDNLRRRGCSCVIVAHRLSTVRDCEEIIVLRQGKVVERGTHDDLIQRQGEYARLIAAQ